MVRRFLCAMGCLLIGGAICGARQTVPVAPLSATPTANQMTMPSPELDVFAAQITQLIEKKHLKSVIVIGAMGPVAGELTQDGQEIGDEISAALTKKANGFQVVDRAALRDFLKQNGVSEAMTFPMLWQTGLPARLGWLDML